MSECEPSTCRQQQLQLIPQQRSIHAYYFQIDKKETTTSSNNKRCRQHNNIRKGQIIGQRNKRRVYQEEKSTIILYLN